jgi:nucleolar GTP-binding protein
MKVKTKKVDGVLNRLHVAMPEPRDEKARPPCIPGEQSTSALCISDSKYE